MIRPLTGITISLSALAMAQAAHAATTVAATANVAVAETAASDAAAEAPADGDSTGLVDIVVTATKRETNLQETPIAIAVMGNEEIKKRHVQSLIDLADGAIPSLRVATFEARQSALTVGLRGIALAECVGAVRAQQVLHLARLGLQQQRARQAVAGDDEFLTRLHPLPHLARLVAQLTNGHIVHGDSAPLASIQYANVARRTA